MNRNLRWLALVGSLGLIAVGAYVMIFNKHEASLAGSLFTVVGTAGTVLQFFVPLPVMSLTQTPNAGLTAPPAPGQRPVSSVGRPIPLVFGAAFALSAVLDVFAVFILLVHGANPSPEVLIDSGVAIIAGGFVASLAYPGFHALQAAKAGYFSVFGSSLAVTSLLVTCIDEWIYVDGYTRGLPAPPAAFRELGVVSGWLWIAASLLIAVTIVKAGIIPAWTAWVTVITALISAIWLAGYDDLTMQTVYRLNALAGEATVFTFAWYLSKDGLSRAGQAVGLAK